jgi:uncharacterized OB-fold protein
MPDTTWLAEHLVWDPDRTTAVPGSALRLAGGTCAECHRTSFPSTQRCAWCGGVTTDVALDTTGTVVATTSVLHDGPGSLVPAPCDVALVRFAEVGLDLLGVLGSAGVVAGDRVQTVATEIGEQRLMHFTFRKVASS